MDEPGVPEIIGIEDLDHDHDQDGYVESMPGFHEHDEGDLDPSQHDEDGDEYPLMENQTSDIVSGKTRMDTSGVKPRPPVSAPARSSPNAGVNRDTVNDICKTRNVASVAKPASTCGVTFTPLNSSVQTGPRLSKEPLECPVCNKTIYTDNQGLNAHIDFCLSRSAIREAQAESITGSNIKPSKMFSKR